MSGAENSGKPAPSPRRQRATAEPGAETKQSAPDTEPATDNRGADDKAGTPATRTSHTHLPVWPD